MDRIGKEIGGIIRRNADREKAPATRTPRVPAPPPLVPSSIGQQAARAVTNTYSPQPSVSANIGRTVANAAQPVINVPPPPPITGSIAQLGREAIPTFDTGPVTGLGIGAPGIVGLDDVAMPDVIRTKREEKEPEEWGVYDVDGVSVAMPSDIAEDNGFDLVSARTTTNPDEVDRLSNNHISYTNMPEEVTSKIKLPELPGRTSSFGKQVQAEFEQVRKEVERLPLAEKAQELEQFATTAATAGTQHALTVSSPEWQDQHKYVIVKNSESNETYLMRRDEWNAGRERRDQIEAQTGKPHVERVMTNNVDEQKRQSMIDAGILNPDTHIIGQNKVSLDSTIETSVLDAVSVEDAARMAAERRARIGSDIVVIDGKEYPAGTTEPLTATVDVTNVNQTDLPPAPDGYVWVMEVPSNSVGILGSLGVVSDVITGAADVFLPGDAVPDLTTINGVPVYLVPETRNREGKIIVGPNQTILNHPDDELPNALTEETVASTIGLGAQGVDWVMSDGIGWVVNTVATGVGNLVPKPISDGYKKYVKPTLVSVGEMLPEGIIRDTWMAMVDNPLTGILVVAEAPQKANIKNMTLVAIYPDDTGVIRDGGAMVFRNMPGVNFYMDWVEENPELVRDIYENGYDADKDGTNELTGIDAVQEYWHLEVLDDDVWGETKWLTFQLFSDPTAYAGAGAVGGRLLRGRGIKLKLSPGASTAKIRTGRVIETTGTAIERTSRTVEGVADLGIEYIAGFGANALKRIGATKPVSSEVRNSKKTDAEGVIVSSTQREVVGGGNAAGPGAQPQTRVPNPPGTQNLAPPRPQQPASPQSAATQPRRTTLTPGTSIMQQTGRVYITTPAGVVKAVKNNRPSRTTPAPRTSPGPTPSQIIYGPAVPMRPTPGTMLQHIADADKWQVVDVATGKPVDVGEGVANSFETPGEAIAAVDPAYEVETSTTPRRWMRGPDDPARPRKINRIPLDVYNEVWSRLNGAWTESVLRMRSLGSGVPTIAHNNESHRIALMTNDAIKAVDPSDTLPWEMNRYRDSPIAYANEAVVRLPWKDTWQERDYLAGMYPMDWGGNVVQPRDTMLRAGPVPADATAFELLAYNNAVDTTFYHVKWQGDVSFNDVSFIAWFIDVARTDFDLRATGRRTIDPFTPPPIWEMSEIPADIRPFVEEELTRAQAALAAPTAQTPGNATAPTPPAPTVQPPSVTVSPPGGAPVPQPPVGTMTRQPGTMMPNVPAYTEPAPSPFVEADFENNGVAAITDESYFDEDIGQEVDLIRIDFTQDGSVYAKAESIEYRDVPRAFRKRYPGVRGVEWKIGSVTDGTRAVDVYAPNEAEFVNASIAVAKAEGWLPDTHPSGISTASDLTAVEIDATNVREFVPGMKEGKVLKNGKMGKPRQASKIKAIPGNLKNAGDTVTWTPDRGGPIVLERMIDGRKKFFVAHTEAGDIYFRGTGSGFKILDNEMPILNGEFQDVPYRFTRGDGSIGTASTGMEPDFIVNYIYTQHTNAFDAQSGVTDAGPITDATVDATVDADADAGTEADTEAQPAPATDVSVDTSPVESGEAEVLQPQEIAVDSEPEPVAVPLVDTPPIEAEVVPDVSRETIAVEPVDAGQPRTVRARSSRPRTANRAVAGFRQRNRRAVVQSLTPAERSADLAEGYRRADDTMFVQPELLVTMPELFQPRRAMNEESVQNIAAKWDSHRQEPIDTVLVNGKDVVWSGHHRLDAAMYAKAELGQNIEVRIRRHDWGLGEEGNIREAQRLADLSNTSRTRLAPMDEAGVVRRAKLRGESFKDIAQSIGVREIDVVRLDKVYDLPPALQQALTDNWDVAAARERSGDLMTLRKAALIADEIAEGRLTVEGSFEFYIQNIVNDPMTDAQFQHFLRTRAETFESLGMQSMFEGMDLSVRSSAIDLFNAEMDSIVRGASKDIAAAERSLSNHKKNANLEENTESTRADHASQIKKYEKEAKDYNSALVRNTKELYNQWLKAQKEGAVWSPSGQQRAMDLTTTAPDPAPASATEVVGKPSKPFPDIPPKQRNRIAGFLKRKKYDFTPEDAVYSTQLDADISHAEMGPNQGQLTSDWKESLRRFHEWILDGRKPYNLFDDDRLPLNKEPVPAAPKVVNTPAGLQNQMDLGAAGIDNLSAEDMLRTQEIPEEPEVELSPAQKMEAQGAMSLFDMSALSAPTTVQVIDTEVQAKTEAFDSSLHGSVVKSDTFTADQPQFVKTEETTADPTGTIEMPVYEPNPNGPAPDVSKADTQFLADVNKHIDTYPWDELPLSEAKYNATRRRLDSIGAKLRKLYSRNDSFMSNTNAPMFELDEAISTSRSADEVRSKLWWIDRAPGDTYPLVRGGKLDQELRATGIDPENPTQSPGYLNRLDDVIRRYPKPEGRSYLSEYQQLNQYRKWAVSKIEMPVYRPGSEIHDAVFERGVSKLVADIQSGSATDASIQSRIGRLRDNAVERNKTTRGIDEYVDTVLEQVHDATASRRASERVGEREAPFRQLHPEAAENLDIALKAPAELRDEFLNALWDYPTEGNPSMAQVGRLSTSINNLYDAGFGGSQLSMGAVRDAVRSSGYRDTIFHIAQRESEWVPPSGAVEPIPTPADTVTAGALDDPAIDPRIADMVARSETNINEPFQESILFEMNRVLDRDFYLKQRELALAEIDRLDNLIASQQRNIDRVTSDRALARVADTVRGTLNSRDRLAEAIRTGDQKWSAPAEAAPVEATAIPDAPVVSERVKREIAKYSTLGRMTPAMRRKMDSWRKVSVENWKGKVRANAIRELGELDAQIELEISEWNKARLTSRGKEEAAINLVTTLNRRGELLSIVEDLDAKVSAGENALSKPGEKIVDDILDDPNIAFATVPGGVLLSKLASRGFAKVKAKMVVDTLHAERHGFVQDTQGNATWMGHPILEEEVFIITEVPFADGTTVMSRVEDEFMMLGNRDKWRSPATVYEQKAIRKVMGEYETRLLEVYPDGVLPNWAKNQIKRLPKWVQDKLEAAARALRAIVGTRDSYLTYRRQRMLARRDRMFTYPATQYLGNVGLTIASGHPMGMLHILNPKRAAEIRRVQESGRLPQSWEPQLGITPAQAMNQRLGIRGATEAYDVYRGRQLGSRNDKLIGEETIRKILPGRAGDAGAWLWGSNKNGSRTVMRAAAGDIVYREFIEIERTTIYMANEVIPDWRNQTINYLIDHAGLTKEIATREVNHFINRRRNWEFSYNDVNDFFSKVQGVTPGQAERLARNWQQAVNQTQKRVRAEIRRTAFASPTTRADLVLQRILIFHYFQSRQTWFLANQMMKHPVLINMYRDVHQSLEDASEDWPSFLKGWVNLLGLDVFGRAIFYNPVALLSTYLMFNDRSTIWEGGEERDTTPADWRWWMDTFGFAPDITDVTNLLGLQGDTWAPDILGVGYESNLLTMAINWGRAHGYIGDNPRPIGDYYRDAQVLWRHHGSGIMNRIFGTEQVENRSSQSSFDREIAAIAYDEARKDGLDPNNAEDKAAIDLLLADTDSDLYRRSVKRWVNGELAEIGIRSVAGMFRPRFRHTNLNGEDLMTNMSRAEKQAINTADPRVRIFRNQQNGYYQFGTAKEQALMDIHSDIINGDVDGPITVDGITYTVEEIQGMNTDQRKALANGFFAELGVMDDINVVREERAKFLAQPENAEFATYKRWQTAVYQYDGGPEAYWEQLRKENPAADFYYENTIMAAESPEERKRLMTNNNAYFSILGYHVSVWDEAPPSFDNRGEAFDPVNIVNQAPTPTPYEEPNAEFRNEVRTTPVFASEMEEWDANVTRKREELGMNTTVPFDQLSYKDRKAVEDSLKEEGITEPTPTWQQRIYMDWAEKKLAENPRADVSMEAFFAEESDRYYQELPGNTAGEINKVTPVEGPDKYGNTPAPSTNTNAEFWYNLLDLLNEHDHKRYPKD